MCRREATQAPPMQGGQVAESCWGVAAATLPPLLMSGPSQPAMRVCCRNMQPGINSKTEPAGGGRSAARASGAADCKAERAACH